MIGSNINLSADTVGTLTGEPMVAAKNKINKSAEIIKTITKLEKQIKAGNTATFNDLVYLMLLPIMATDVHKTKEKNRLILPGLFGRL